MHLLKKGVPFVWDEFTRFLFDVLKNALTSAPLLSPSDYSIEFLLYLTAEESNINMVLI